MMFWFLRILTCWIPVGIHHVEKIGEYLRIRLSELGVKKRLSDALLSRLANEAYRRAKEKAFFGWVSYGLFMFEVTRIADEAANYIKFRNVEEIDPRVSQIIELNLDD